MRAGLTGYTVNVQNLTEDSDEWVAGGTPVTMMLNMEVRKGKPTPVIKKALVDLDGAPFQYFADNRDCWAIERRLRLPRPDPVLRPNRGLRCADHHARAGEGRVLLLLLLLRGVDGFDA